MRNAQMPGVLAHAACQPAQDSQVVLFPPRGEPAWGRLLPEGAETNAWELNQSSCTIGRNKACDLVINLPVISNFHCKITKV
jgi:hypothetical protein